MPREQRPFCHFVPPPFHRRRGAGAVVKREWSEFVDAFLGDL